MIQLPVLSKKRIFKEEMKFGTKSPYIFLLGFKPLPITALKEIDLPWKWLSKPGRKVAIPQLLDILDLSKHCWLLSDGEPVSVIKTGSDNPTEILQYSDILEAMGERTQYTLGADLSFEATKWSEITNQITPKNSDFLRFGSRIRYDPTDGSLRHRIAAQSGSGIAQFSRTVALSSKQDRNDQTAFVKSALLEEAVTISAWVVKAAQLTKRAMFDVDASLGLRKFGFTDAEISEIMERKNIHERSEWDVFLAMAKAVAESDIFAKDRSKWQNVCGEILSRVGPKGLAGIPGIPAIVAEIRKNEKC